MKDIIIGFGLLFCVPSCIYFWLELIDREKKENEEIERKWWRCD